MNHLCYKTIFSKHLGTLVAVGEHACSQSKGQGASAGTRAAAGILDARFVGMLALGFAWVSLAWSQTLPQGPQVAQGVVSFSQSAKQMDITQSTAKAVVNWQSFDIGQNAKVNITQPSSQSVLLNRVLSDNPTQILGQLQANGQVVLVNPKGIVVGSDGSVSASAFTASTLNISDADFMAGNGRYTRNGSTGQVINKGRIEVAPGGYVALLGASVSNEGQIIAPQGGVALGAAETVTVPIGRTGKIKLELTPASINASVTNQKDGVIVAEGGQVYMQAAALGQAVASVLNSGSIDTSGVQAGAVHVLADGGQIKVDGRITANSSGQDDKGQQRKGGDIFIGRDEATGVLAKATDVSGAKLESAKGFVETSGDVLSTTGTRVKASEWLLDPYNITIAAGAATGTNYNSYTSGADSTILASDISANLTAGTSVTIATGAGGTSAGFIAVNESIAKTGGVDATLTLQAHSNITVAANKTITSNTGKLNVVFNSDSDGTNGGGIVLNSGSGITSNGGNITLGGGIAGNGSGFAIADGSSALQGIALQTATISAGGGNIVMNGLSATTSATAVVGISMSGGTITTTGAGQITLTGKNQLTGTTGATGTGFSMSSGTITGGSTGAVTIEGNSSTSSVTSTNNKGAIINGTVTSTGGDISITGIGGAGAQYDNGVDIGGSVLGVGSANISITGTAASGSVGDNVGVTTSGTATISSVNGNINITGTGGTGNGARIRNHGVSVGSSNAIQSTGSGSITVTGRAINTDNGYSQGVVISTGGLRTNTGNIKVDARVPQNYQVAASITAAIASTSGNVYVRSAGGKITNSSTGTISGNNVSIENTNGSIDANGVITIGAGGASSWSGVISQIGIDLGGSVTATNNLNVYGNQTGFDAGVKMSGATTTVSGKNVTLYGKSSTSNGVLLSGATLSGQYIKATGATNTGTAGFAWQGGKINTTGTAGTSTASVVKGISAASGNTLGFGAFMMIANSTTNAASGTSLTFAGEATNLAAGVNTNERGILVQGGYTLAASGDITFDGSSKSSEGIAFGGTINMATVAGVTNKLTIKGTAAASTNNSWNALNFSGAINANAATSSINFMGDAKNLSGANKDNGVNISGAISGSTANVNIQSTGATIVTGSSATITGANISIDNTNGTINSSTGAITAGAATAGSANGLSMGGSITAAANLNLLGVSTSATGINLAAAGTLSGANIQATGNTGGIYGLDLGLGSSVITTGSSGASVLTGNGASTSGSGNAVVMLRGNTLTAASGSTLTIVGNATTSAASNYLNTRGLRVGGATTTNGAVTLSGNSKSADGLLVQDGAINVNTGSLTLNGVSTATGSLGGAAGVAINKAITLNNGTSLAITGNTLNQGTATVAESGVYINAAIGQASGQTTAGNISITGSSGSYANSNGVVISASGTVATGAGNIAIVGQRAVGGMGAAVSTAASVTSTSGNVTLQSIGGTVTQTAGTISGANITIDNTGAGLTSLIADTTGGQPTLAIGTALGGSINAATGALTAGSRLNVNAGAVSIAGALATPGNINILGNVATTTNSGVNLASTGSATTSGSGSIIKIQSNGNVVAGGAIGNTGSSGATSSINLTSTSGSVSGSGTLTSNGVTASGGGMTIHTALAGTMSGAISGAGSLTKTGAGTTVLTATNSYSGTSTVSTGVLQIGDGGTTGTLGTGAVIDNASLVFNRSNSVTVANAISGTGSLTQMGSGTTILTADNSYAGANIVSGGTLQVGNGGSTGTLGAGDVTLSNNATLSYVRSASTTIANNIAGTGNVSANITGATSDLTVNRSINLTGGTANLVTDGNLLVKQAISTTNATASAVFLESGKSTAAGTATGGDIQFSGSGAVTVGSGGRATYMTGSVLGSTGMGVLVGNNRYNSDEVTTSYTAALGSGAYAIYREQPLVTVQVDSASKTYDGLSFSGGSLNTTLTSGALVNGDSFAALTNNASLSGTAQGAKNVSAIPYAITASDAGGKNALGYGLTYNAGSLTINKANLTVTANPVTKTYDGTVNATGTGTVAALAGVAGGDVVNNAGSQAFLDANAGANKTVRASGVTIKDAANADMTGNYNITYTDNTSSLINKANLTVTANNDARFVGRTDNTQYAGVSYAGFVNGETPAVLGGTLAITRTNSDMAAGVYAGVLSANGLTSGNYNIAYNPGTYTIVPADQLLIKTANKTVTYGTALVYETTAQYLDGNSDEIISLTRTGTGNNYTFDDGLGTTVSAMLKPYAGTSLAGTSTSGNTVVGTYSIKDLNPIVNGGNFVGAPVFVGNLTVNTQEITPNASGVTKVYDATTAMNNVVVGLTGKLNTDNVSISGTGAFSQKHAGTGLGYTVSNVALSGADAGNYHLAGGTSSFSGTDGVITPATLKLTTSNVSKTYDGTTSALGSAVATQSTQLLGTDTVSGGTFAFTNKNASTGDKVVTVSGVTIDDGNNGGNYSVTYVDNTTSTINKANLTLKAVTDSKTYNGTVASNKTVEVINASGSSDVVTVAQEFASKNALGLNASTLQLTSGYTIKDTGGADMSGNYNVTTQTAMGTINKKDVTLDSITAANKIYDGGNTASITSGAITTGVGSETLAIGGSGTFADKHAADGKTVTVSDVTALSKTDGSGSWANYNLTTTGALSTTASITPRALSLSAVTASKTYDGTTSASGTVAVSGNQVGDTITATQVFDSKHALGTGASTLKVDTFSINDGNDGKNYSVTQNTATGTIQKASLTVTASQVEKTYDGTTSATGSGTVGTLAGQAAGEAVNAAGSQAFVSKNASTGDKYVKASGVTIKDSANADVTQNYDINYVDNTTSTIHKANLSVAMSNQTKVYDGTTQASLAAGAITATGITLNGVTETASVTQTTGTYNDKNVANANTVTAALQASHFTSGTADVSNYNLPTTVSNTTSTITKANLAVTLANQSKVYDGTNQASLAAGAITATGVTVGGVTETATVTQTVGSYNSKNVASANTVTATLAAGQFTAGTADLGNYNLPTTVSNTSSTITQAALTLTASSDLNKVYNGSEQSVSGFAITSGSLQGTDSLAVDLANITAGAKATHAGTHTSTVNDSAYTNGNYAITKVNGTLFIDQKEVSLSAAKTYDGSKTLTGTQLSISTGVGSETLGYTLATIHSKNVGDNNTNYVDAVSLSNGINGGLASNYKLPALTAAGSGNTVVLTAKALSASIANVNTTYGSATATGAVSLSGKVDTDDVLAASAATLVSADTSTSGQIRAGSYVQTVSAGLTGTDAGNYSFAGSTTPTANYVVNKLALTGAIAQGLSTYSNTLVAGAVSLTNTVSGDDVLASGVNIDTTGKTSTSGHLKAGVHTGIQTLTGLTGADKDNYTFADIKGDYKVNQLALTGTIAKGETVYGASLLTGAVNLTNKVGTDMVDANGVSIDTTGKTSTSGKLTAGEHLGIQTLSGLTGADMDNYTFANVKGDYKVKKLALTGSIAQGESVYGSALQAGAVTLTNKVGTDVVDASGVSIDTTGKTSSSGHLKASVHTGIQTLTGLSGGDLDNYTFADIKGDYKVNKLALTVASIADVTTTYASAADAGAVSFDNKQGADKVTASASIVGGTNSTSGNLKAGSYKQTTSAISGDDAGNYSFEGFTTTDNNYVVNKLALTGAAIAGVTTTYATAANAGAVSFTNVQGTDKVTASASIMGVDNSSSGNLKAGSYNQTSTAISGDDSANYSFAGVTTTDNNYVVNKLALTGAAIAGVTTTYATAADAGAVSFTNVQGTDKVTASASIMGVDNSSSGNLKAGSYNQTASAISGDDSANYSFAGVTTTDNNYVVNKLALSGAAIAGVTTTYATAADAGAVSFTNVQGADKVTASASIVGGSNSTSGNLKAGSYQQSATSISGDDAANYSFGGATTTDKNYVVNKLALTGAAIAGVTTTYATAADVGSVSFTNVQGADKVTASASIVDTATSTSGNLKAGSYNQTATAISGDDAANYSFAGVTTTDNNYVVNKLALTGAAIAGVSTTYATAADAGVVSFGNVQGTDKVTASASIVDTATSTSGNLRAGSYNQTATAISGDDSANYSFAGVTTTDNNYVVNKLALSGAAIAGVTTTYVTAADAGSVSFTNVQGADKVTASASIVDTATSTSGNLKAGSYKQTATTISGDDSANYSFAGVTTTDNNYVVNKLALTGAAIAGVSTTYATAADAGSVSFTNVQGADKVTASASIVNAATSTSGNLKAGSYNQTSTAISGDDSANYSFAGVTTTDNNYVVNKLALSGAAIAGVTTTYATAANAGAVSFTNVQGADKVTAAASIVDAVTSTSGNLKAGSYNQTATAINGDDSANYSFAGVTTTDNNYMVDKKTITLSDIIASSKTYDGNNTATVSVAAATFDGMVLGDKLSVVSTGTFSDKNAATGKTVSLVNTLGGADLGNYSITDQANTTADISKKTITLSGITASNKTYDGNTSATVSVTGAVFNDMVTGDKLSVASTGTFSDKNVATGKTVSLVNTLGGDDLGNYTITDQANTTANISKKDLHISGLTAAHKVYDGKTTATMVTGAAIFDGLVQDDVVTLSATGSFDTRHVGQSKPVVISSTFDGQDVGNYNITSQSLTTANITPAPLKIKATAVRKTYDGTTLANGTGVVVGVLAGAEAGDKIDQAGFLSFTDKNAGTGKTVTVKGARLIDSTLADVTGNYSIEYIDSLEGVIDRAQASISAAAMSVTYNGQTQSQSAAVLSGFVSGDDVQAGGLASGRQVGSYASALTATGRDVGNYTITFNNAALQIGKKAASLSSLDQSVVYNGQTQSLVGTQGSGFVVGDDLIFGGLPSGRQVGQYTSALMVSGSDASNYDITYGHGKLTITPKDALVSAQAQSVTYNGSMQLQSAPKQEGFVPGDDLVVAGWAQGRDAGTYPSNLLVGGADAKNYTIRFQQADLQIQKAMLGFVGTTVSDKLADGNTVAQVTAGRITGLMGAESLNISAVTGRFADAAAGTGKSVEVVYGLSNGQNGGLVGNYDWSPVVLKANITAPTVSNLVVTESQAPKQTYSRIYYQGYGGLARVGATTGQASYSLRPNTVQACTPQKLEDCICERPSETSMEICFSEEQGRQAQR